jgi:hypothetical protein
VSLGDFAAALVMVHPPLPDVVLVGGNDLEMASLAYEGWQQEDLWEELM